MKKVLCLLMCAYLLLASFSGLICNQAAVGEKEVKVAGDEIYPPPADNPNSTGVDIKLAGDEIYPPPADNPNFIGQLV